MRKTKNLFTQIVDALVDDGYIIIPNALNPLLAQNLEKTAKNISDYKPASISTKKIKDHTKRKDKIKWIDEDGSYQSEYLEFTQELQETLNRELFLGINYYESHFAMYEKGDFYKTHMDAFKKSKNRIVTTVYYLNETWYEENGGLLVIYDDNANVLTKVIPQANTLVVFLSDKFPHEVLAAKKNRFSIAGWFRIDRNI